MYEATIGSLDPPGTRTDQGAGIGEQKEQAENRSLIRAS